MIAIANSFLKKNAVEFFKNAKNEIRFILNGSVRECSIDRQILTDGFGEPLSIGRSLGWMLNVNEKLDS